MSIKYPIGIQNFESLRNDGYFYVDKTALIYQSGYLTIKPSPFGRGDNPPPRRFGTYYLGFPNREVDEGFMKFLLPFYADTNKVDVAFPTPYSSGK